MKKFLFIIILLVLNVSAYEICGIAKGPNPWDNGHVYIYNMTTRTWANLGWEAVRCSYDDQGRVWIVNSSGRIMRRMSPEGGWSVFSHIPIYYYNENIEITDIAAPKGSSAPAPGVAIATKTGVYMSYNPVNPSFGPKIYNHHVKSVSNDGYGCVWMLSIANYLYEFEAGFDGDGILTNHGQAPFWGTPGITDMTYSEADYDVKCLLYPYEQIEGSYSFIYNFDGYVWDYTTVSAITRIDANRDNTVYLRDYSLHGDIVVLPDNITIPVPVEFQDIAISH